MSNNTSNKTIYAYSLHAQDAKFTGNYLEIFEVLKKVPRDERKVKLKGTTYAVPTIEERHGTYFLTFLQGTEDIILIYDEVTGETKEDELGDHEILVSASHALFLPSKRAALVEYVKSGAKAPVIEEVIREILSRHYGAEFKFMMSPRIERDFLNEIDQLERIRLVSLSLVKPNAGWDDHYTLLSELADQSNGEKIDLTVRAGRGESLSKEEGIMEVVRNASEDEYPYVMDAEVIGTKVGEIAETKIPLNNHKVRRNVAVQKIQGKRLNVSSLRDKMIALIGVLF